jgi:tetratricopeptide (TPR) repeat protein
MNCRRWSPLALLAAVLSSPVANAAPPVSAPLLEALLATEFARQSGDVSAAAAFALAAADASNDPGLAAQALESALIAADAQKAQAALLRWQTLEIRSPRRDALALRFHIAQGEDELAQQAALRLLVQPEHTADVTGALGVAYLDGGVMARAVLRGLLAAPEFPQRIDAWLAMAGAAQRLGDRALSGAWVDGLVSRFPADPRAGLLRAERLSQAGRREAARAEVRLVLNNPQISAEQRQIAAEALAVLGDPEAAARAVAVGPQSARTLSLRATWLTRAGKLDGLRLLYTEAQALALSNTEPALPMLLGELAERLQDWPAAERWYRGITLGEAGDRARLRLGVVLARQGRHNEAGALLQALQQDDAVDGTVRRDAFVLEADQLEARKQRPDAERVLTRGLSVLEDDPVLRVARARLERNSGAFAEAEADLRAVIARDAEFAPALRALGSLLLARQRPAEAQPILANAWAREPGAPTAAALGEALWLLGRQAEARAAWAEGRALDPSDPVLTDTLRRYSP